MERDYDQENLWKRETAPSAPQQAGPLGEELLPPLSGVAPEAVLSDPAIGARGNAPVRAAAVQRMQQLYGNRATRRFLQRSLASATALPVQRDNTSSLPPVPNYQLPPPSLLPPQDPADRYHLLGNYHLQLDPQVQAMLDQHLSQQLDPGKVRTALANLQLGPLPTGQPPGPNPFAGPSVPPPGPLVPAGAGPATPRAAGAGDLMGAVLAVPAIDQAVTQLRTQAKDQITRDWDRLRTGEKVATVSTVAIIALGALGGAMADPNARQVLLSQLNGRVLPVPGVDWLRVETNIGGDNLMFGLHVDVGQLLPPSWGFGPGSPSAIGGPPGARF